ncbi:8892_t:CDS:2 [Gigaspora margarita]|uniref:8892_t:CDS:1 n=1 Tax=Gigaspora margarita TaxID=4874 RepID=A0ABN7UHG8_GIGMA|nr:8892_t:CDS:2 [Gigaspora margarita]
MVFDQAQLQFASQNRSLAFFFGVINNGKIIDQERRPQVFSIDNINSDGYSYLSNI